MPKRITGFQRPFSTNQLASWFLMTFAAASFFGLGAAHLDGERFAAPAALFAATYAAAVLLWLHLETTDPAAPGGCLPRCVCHASGKPKATSRYCQVRGAARTQHYPAPIRRCPNCC